MTTHLWPQTNPQQFVSTASGRNPWAVPAAQTKPTSAPTKPKPPPTLPKSEFLQLEPKVSAPTPVVQQSMVAPGPKPQQKHKAPPEAAPEDFVQLRGGRGWGTAVTKPAPVVPVTKKKLVPVVAPATAVVPTPAPAPAAPAPTPAVTEEDNTSQSLYKTELCRSFEETGTCRYGAKCQFAHGRAELRPVLRHPKYKTEVCKTFHTIGTCPYGKRCRFIHSPAEAATAQVPATPAVTEVAPVASQPKVPSLETIEWSTSWTGNAPTKTTPRSTPLSSPTKATQAVPAVTIQKTATPVFPAPESKPITSEGFLPATTVFMPSFPARDFVELSPKKTIPIEEAIVAAVTDPSVFPTAPVVAPLDTTSPRSVVATVPPPVVDDEDAEDEEALARRLSIFAQICSNDD